MVYKVELIQNWYLNFIYIALEEFIENLVGQGFDSLYNINFIKDIGKETCLIRKNSFWFGYFWWFGIL